MHVVIVGCGRVGSALAKELIEANHTVAIIDRREEAFSRLDASFTGQKIVGIGFDRDVLATAGIQHCDAVAAVTSGDNSNILIARVARENFGIERVVARIYDPQRAAVYQRLGIATVATVSWTTERVLRRVLPPEAAVEWVDPSANVSLIERHIESPNAGRKYTDIEDSAKVRVVAVARLGKAMLMTPTLVAQEGDLMYLAVATGDVDSLNSKLNTAVVGGHA
ncbi:MAG: transport system, NAD-binding component [Acidimicrobiales bacterium]|nr:transport system, NAD-binding component [Acidimicrobiales bacterium]